MILDRLGPEEMAEVSIILETSAKMGFQLLKKLYAASHEGGVDRAVVQQLLQYSRETPFVFRGTKEDLAYFWSRKELTIEQINALPEDLRANVMRGFTEYQRSGLVTFDGQTIRLTENGNRYIHDVGFVSDVVKEDQELNQAIQMNMDGAMQRFRPSADAASYSAAVPTQAATSGAAANTAATAATEGAKAAGSAAGAAASAGITVAAQVAQETVSHINKTINNLITH